MEYGVRFGINNYNMDNILQQTQSYLCRQTTENLQRQNAKPEQQNNYEFTGSHYGNTGIISVGERIR